MLVEMTTDRDGLIEFETNQHILANHSCLAVYGVVQVAPEKTFKILVAIFDDEPQTLFKEQTIANPKPHPASIQESVIIHRELLGSISHYMSTGEKK